MINIHDYFSIDWKATGDNLRDLMSDTVSEETLAKSMYVTKRPFIIGAVENHILVLTS